MNRRLLALSLSLLFLAPGAASAQEIVREAVGSRLEALEQMELKPFPTQAWDALTSWTNGPAITGAATSGKPVLIVTWASWSPAAGRALSTAQRMADKFGGDGLIVVAAHNPQGWDEAPKLASDRGIKVAIAHDAKGDFRKALKIDNDPEYYLIDRAGNLRFASVKLQSVEEACAALVKESQADASNLPKLLADRESAKAAAAARTGAIREDLDLTKLPPVPPGFVQPSPDAYKSAAWPRAPKQEGGFNNGPAAERRFSGTPTAYFPAPPTAQGRVAIVYFWHPSVRASYEGVMDAMDRLQTGANRDLAVLGIMVPQNSLVPNSGNAQNAENAESMKKRFDEVSRSRTFRHAIGLDATGGTLTSAFGGTQGLTNPAVAIVSSDGVVRWWGRAGEPDFRTALDVVLTVDPGVRARRAADRQFIGSQK